MAAMLPFLEAIEHGRDFPHKCLYAVPMRVLANQFVKEFTDRVRRAGRDDRIRVAIQTGEHADDKDLTATLTFATIDQVLSSFLLTPYSLSRRKSNLNAGAVVASYLVFDEFHLFDPISTLPTTLEMLRMLRGVTPFLLMTATFSTDMLDGLASVLDAVVVPKDEATRQAMQALPSQQKTRRYHVAGGPLCADAVLAQHRKHRSRTLVVCNVVDRARALFEALRDHPDRCDAQVLLLHSRFLPEDRQRIEGEIRKLFSKGEDSDSSGSWIVVATQVVEVGLDITCETLHTELAPANAVLQRAGRCARYEDEDGDVFIYAKTFDAEGETVNLTENVMPYKGQKEEVACTLAEFQDPRIDLVLFEISRLDSLQWLAELYFLPRERVDADYTVALWVSSTDSVVAGGARRLPFDFEPTPSTSGWKVDKITAAYRYLDFADDISAVSVGLYRPGDEGVTYLPMSGSDGSMIEIPFSGIAVQ